MSAPLPLAPNGTKRLTNVIETIWSVYNKANPDNQRTRAGFIVDFFFQRDMSVQESERNTANELLAHKAVDELKGLWLNFPLVTMLIADQGADLNNRDCPKKPLYSWWNNDQIRNCVSQHIVPESGRIAYIPQMTFIPKHADFKGLLSQQIRYYRENSMIFEASIIEYGYDLIIPNICDAMLGFLNEEGEVFKERPMISALRSIINASKSEELIKALSDLQWNSGISDWQRASTAILQLGIAHGRGQITRSDVCTYVMAIDHAMRQQLAGHGVSVTDI